MLPILCFGLGVGCAMSLGLVFDYCVWWFSCLSWGLWIGLFCGWVALYWLVCVCCSLWFVFRGCFTCVCKMVNSVVVVIL